MLVADPHTGPRFIILRGAATGSPGRDPNHPICLESGHQRASRRRSRIADAAKRNASADLMVAWKSLARRRLRLIQAKNRSTTQRLGRTTKPTWSFGLLTISTLTRPAPADEADRRRECLFIRQAIVRQVGLGGYGAATATSPLMADAIRARVGEIVAALQRRAANIGCTAAFSPAASGAARSSRLGFDECFSRCVQLTGRTKGQCFDACK